MQAPDSADECLDPALMSAFEDGAVDPFGRYADADAGPPSPFDMSTIDPDLLALYPEQNGGPDCNAASPPLVPLDVEAEDFSISPPPLHDEPSATSTSTEDTESGAHNQSPPKKRVRFASLRPHDPPAPESETQVSSYVERPVTRGQARKPPSRRLSTPLPKKHSPLSTAKRTISDGRLVPPYSCARCVWEDEECLIKYPGAACNVCRRRGRRCELVDEQVKFNGQRAKDLMREEGGAGSG